MTDKPRRTNPASATNGRAGGRPIGTAKIRVGDKIGIRIGYGTEMARGVVTEITKTLPRAIKVDLGDDEHAWITFA